LALAQDEWRAAQLCDGDLHRNAGPGGRLLEDQRDRAPVKRARGVAVRLQLQSAVEDAIQLLVRNLRTSEKVAGHRGIVVRALSWNLFHGRDLPVEVDYKRSL